MRPVHWLVMLYGEEAVPARLFGLDAARDSRGHRFHHPERITLAEATAHAPPARRAGWWPISLSAARPCARR